MVKVAICDDDINHIKITTGLLYEYMKQRTDVSLVVSTFSSGEELLLSEDYINFDIYILDVLMPELNGIKTALNLRDGGAKGEIIYLTNSSDYAVESYETQAFFYLLKPVDRMEFFNVLDRVIKHIIEKNKDYIIINTKNGLHRILLNHILYVERVDRAMLCHCLNGEQILSVSLRGSFRSEVKQLLKDKCFVSCGASFVINLHHVCSIKDNIAEIDNGNQIQIPRRLTKQIKQDWMDYWLEDGSGC